MQLKKSKQNVIHDIILYYIIIIIISVYLKRWWTSPYKAGPQNRSLFTTGSAEFLNEEIKQNRSVST